MKKHEKKQSNLDFRFMSLFFWFRDKRSPPIEKIKKTKIQSGNSILDYGCGSGSYTLAAAKEIGLLGKIYAADIHPLAIKKIKKKIHKHNLNNIETILTNCNTDLTDNSIDSILCFDVIHGLDNFQDILEEFYRILKPNGYLSVDDHHLDENNIKLKITSQGTFTFTEKKEEVYTFNKVS